MSADLEKAGMCGEDFDFALRYLADKFPEIKIVSIFDYENDNPAFEEERTGAEPAFATIILPNNFLKLAFEIRRNCEGQPILENLQDKSISFDNETGILKIGDKNCQLPPFKKEHFFCGKMFSFRKEEPVDWSLVYQEMRERDPVDFKGEETAKAKKAVEDAMYSINRRVREIMKTEDDLFSSKNLAIRRNF